MIKNRERNAEIIRLWNLNVSSRDIGRQLGITKNVINGVVKRTEYGNLMVDLGRAEALLRRDETIPREALKTGDRVTVTGPKNDFPLHEPAPGEAPATAVM